MNKNFIRIIPKLDIKNGLLIKGINLEGLRVLGNSFDYAYKYYKNGADELFYLDNVATLYGTINILKFVKKSARNLFVPLTVGGGISCIEDIKRTLVNGADRIYINSASIKDISIVAKAAKIFGSSTIVCGIEYTKIEGKYFITSSHGRDIKNINPIQWAKKLENNGAGEIVLTSVNNEGLKLGFDIKMIKKITKQANIPVLANGGAGNFEHIYEVIKNTNISGVVVSSLFHYNSIIKNNMNDVKIGNKEFLKNVKIKNTNYNIIKELKIFLKNKKINVNL